MEIANLLYQFFGFQALSDSATLIDLIQCILKIGCGLWVTIFIIRSMFMATSIADRRF